MRYLLVKYILIIINDRNMALCIEVGATFISKCINNIPELAI